jgi:secreted trypsin-like serine protease
MRLRALTAVAVVVALVVAGSATAGEIKPRPSPRIVGGQPAANGAWPTAAFLLGLEDTDGDGQLDPSFGCTGSVVAPTWIVTAAHCLLDSSGTHQVPGLVAVLGVSDYGDPSAELIAASSLIPHPAYNTQSVRNDLALVGLSQPTHSPPIRLASSTEVQAGRYTTMANVVNAAGWGDTDEQATQGTSVLQQAYLAIQPDDDCVQLVPFYDPNTMTCAGTPLTSGACSGDSGGPLVVFDVDTGERVLWGTTSYGPQALFGLPPCSLQLPVAFSWIPAFRDFIDSHINPPPPPPVPAPQPVATVAASVDRTRPIIRSLRLSRTAFRAARRGSMFAAAVGTVLTYRLSEQATVKVTVQRRTSRRGRVRWRSLRPSGSLRGSAGLNAVTFRGRLPDRRLTPGRYRLSLRATDAAGNRSPRQTVVFRIIR